MKKAMFLAASITVLAVLSASARSFNAETAVRKIADEIGVAAPRAASLAAPPAVRQNSTQQNSPSNPPAQNNGNAAAREPVSIEGSGLVLGGGTYRNWISGGTVIVKGFITVTGPGVSGKANVTGIIQVDTDFGDVTGEGTVNGSVTLTDANGHVAGTTTVSGPVTLHGSFTTIHVPFLGDQTVVQVEGTADVSGTLQP